MHFYFVRHGQSLINLKEWQDGNMDVGLTDLGHNQAAALAQWLPQELPEIAALYSSTMQRARETAELLAGAYEADLTASAMEELPGRQRPVLARDLAALAAGVEISQEHCGETARQLGLDSREYTVLRCLAICMLGVLLSMRWGGEEFDAE